MNRVRKGCTARFGRRVVIVGTLIAGVAPSLAGCNPTNSNLTNQQNSAVRASYAGHIAMSGMSRTGQLQNPLERHSEIEMELNRQTGLNGAVVLQEGPRVYVGLNRSSTLAHRATHISDGAITKLVLRGIPTANKVYITRTQDGHELLRRSADALSNGSDLTRQMVAFHRSIAQIWPETTTRA